MTKSGKKKNRERLLQQQRERRGTAALLESTPMSLDLAVADEAAARSDPNNNEERKQGFALIDMIMRSSPFSPQTEPTPVLKEGIDDSMQHAPNVTKHKTEVDPSDIESADEEDTESSVSEVVKRRSRRRVKHTKGRKHAARRRHAAKSKKKRSKRDVSPTSVSSSRSASTDEAPDSCDDSERSSSDETSSLTDVEKAATKKKKKSIKKKEVNARGGGGGKGDAPAAQVKGRVPTERAPPKSALIVRTIDNVRRHTFSLPITGLNAVRTGTTAVRIGTSAITGSPKPRFFEISEDWKWLTWYSRAKPLEKTSIKFSKILTLCVGQYHSDFDRLAPLFRTEKMHAQSFSIDYIDDRTKRRSMALIMKSHADRNLWLYVIYNLACSSRECAYECRVVGDEPIEPTLKSFPEPVESFMKPLQNPGVMVEHVRNRRPPEVQSMLKAHWQKGIEVCRTRMSKVHRRAHCDFRPTGKPHPAWSCPAAVLAGQNARVVMQANHLADKINALAKKVEETSPEEINPVYDARFRKLTRMLRVEIDMLREKMDVLGHYRD